MFRKAICFVVRNCADVGGFNATNFRKAVGNAVEMAFQCWGDFWEPLRRFFEHSFASTNRRSRSVWHDAAGLYS